MRNYAIDWKTINSSIESRIYFYQVNFDRMAWGQTYLNLILQEVIASPEILTNCTL